MPEIIALGVFLFFVAAISWYGYRVYSKPGRVYERLGETATSPSNVIARPSEAPDGIMVRVVEQVGEKVPVSPADVKLARRYLMAAGFRSENAARIYYGIKVVLCVVMVFFGLLIRDHVTAVPILRMMILGASGLAGWFGPGLVLERLLKKRQEKIRLSLPDALDLMVVCVEAGNGLDQAFVRVSQELAMTHKDICEEFGLVNLEMRAGKRRIDALHNLAERTGESELRKLVAILVQADRFGTSIADSLRTHADFMRIHRRQQAEERANKVGVKLVFPIFFCILPAMFLVTAGPAALAIVKVLLPAMRQAGNQ